jgi:hypothetical protein
MNRLLEGLNSGIMILLMKFRLMTQHLQKAYRVLRLN